MDEDKDLEELRKRKLLEMQNQLTAQQSQEEMYRAQADAMEEQKKAVMRQILTPEARERLARLKMVKPELVENLEMQLIYLVESGRVKQMIDDATLKDILMKMQQGGQKREFKIERR